MREEHVTNIYGWDEVEAFLRDFALFGKYKKLIKTLESELNFAFHKTELLEIDDIFYRVQITLYVPPSVPNAKVYDMQTKAIEILERLTHSFIGDFIIITKHHNGEQV